MTSDEPSDQDTEPHVPEVVDKTPDHANGKAFSDYTPGDPQVEYGIVDTNDFFPAKTYEWRDEIVDPDHPPAKEKHLIVPMRVIQRGFTSRQRARDVAERKNEDQPSERYKVVMVSDPRGI